CNEGSHPQALLGRREDLFKVEVGLAKDLSARSRGLKQPVSAVSLNGSDVEEGRLQSRQRFLEVRVLQHILGGHQDGRRRRRSIPRCARQGGEERGERLGRLRLGLDRLQVSDKPFPSREIYRKDLVFPRSRNDRHGVPVGGRGKSEGDRRREDSRNPPKADASVYQDRAGSWRCFFWGRAGVGRGRAWSPLQE